MASVLHRGRMRYCVSDIHGEYDLFTRLLERIGFSDDDEMYVCGDVLDKGEDSVRLAKLISSLENVRCIIGNHELQFLNYYDSVMEDADNLDDEALLKLREYFPKDAHFLDSELVEWIIRCRLTSRRMTLSAFTQAFRWIRKDAYFLLRRRASRSWSMIVNSRTPTLSLRHRSAYFSVIPRRAASAEKIG